MSDMKNVLRGVVKDHRMPCDYQYHYTQPFHTRAFMKNLKRFFVHRQMTKQNVTTPMYILFFAVPLYVGIMLPLTWIRTGSWPQVLQSQNWLYKKGNYGVQHAANANPDNFWDQRYYCWTSDPACGLDLAPKRPHLDLKNGGLDTMEKFQRDATVHGMKEVTKGYSGF
jgi:hypothetical protein